MAFNHCGAIKVSVFCVSIVLNYTLYYARIEKNLGEYYIVH